MSEVVQMGFKTSPEIKAVADDMVSVLGLKGINGLFRACLLTYLEDKRVNFQESHDEAIKGLNEYGPQINELAARIEKSGSADDKIAFQQIQRIYAAYAERLAESLEMLPKLDAWAAKAFPTKALFDTEPVEAQV